MKILLIGEYSNVHWTLAEGLRALGHEVTVLSNGDFWKDYPRDIDLVRRPGKWGGICYLTRLYRLLPRLRGYDVVQLISPMCLELKAERIFTVYRSLRRQNWRSVWGRPVRIVGVVLIVFPIKVTLCAVPFRSRQPSVHQT